MSNKAFDGLDEIDEVAFKMGLLASIGYSIVAHIEERGGGALSALEEGPGLG